MHETIRSERIALGKFNLLSIRPRREGEAERGEGEEGWKKDWNGCPEKLSIQNKIRPRVSTFVMCRALG